MAGGEIGRDLKTSAGAVELNGRVTRDVVIDMGDVEIDQGTPTFIFPMQPGIPAAIKPGLRVSDDAVIGGEMKYTAKHDMRSSIEAQPSGGIVYQTPVPVEEKVDGRQAPRMPKMTPVLKWFFNIVQTFLTLLILGGLAIWLLPERLARASRKIAERPGASIGYGFVVIIVGYAAAIFLGLVVISLGLLFALVSLGGLGRTVFGVGFSALALVLTIFTLLVNYGSKLVVAFLAGQWVVGKLFPNASVSRIWVMLTGIVIYVLLRAIPVAGWIIAVGVTLLGMGAIFLAVRQWMQSRSAPLEEIVEG
jgi:hypothetical protein